MSRVSSSTRDAGTDTKAARPKRRWRLTMVGVALLVVGLSCLGWVAYKYGEQATALIHQNLPTILTWLAVAVVVVAVAFVVVRRRRATV